MRQAEQDRLNEKIAQVRKIAASRLAKAENEPFDAALDRFFANVSPDQVVETEAEELYGAALALWKFSATRKPGAPKLRLYNPRMTEHGWESQHSVVEVINDDMPFLVDSITSCLTDRGIGIHTLLHPVITVKRDTKGARKEMLEPGAKTGIRESVIQAQVDQIGDEQTLAQIENEMRQVLADVRVAVEDWKPMMARLTQAAEDLRTQAPKKLADETEEVCEFLDWLAQNHFTFLGCREYKMSPRSKQGASVVRGSGLGLMRDADYTVLRDVDGNFADWSPEMDAFLAEGSPLLILKANRRSTVHRTVHFDLIGVKCYDKKGAVAGEHVFIGHFTAAAYNRSPRSIPLLRQKVERVIERAGFAPDGHDGKALTNVLETYPRDELFQSSDDQLYRNAMGVLHLATRPRTRLFVRPDRFNRFVSCLVYVPRERYNTELRVKLGEILSDAFGGRVATWTTSFADEALARTHFVIATLKGGVPDYDVAEIESRIVDAVRDWSDVLQEVLIERVGEHEGNRLHALYQRGFAPAYRGAFNAVTAIDDIEKMEELTEKGPMGLKFYRRLEDPDNAVRFKLFRLGSPVPLSDCLPVLENMGFRILEEHPFEITRGDSDAIWLHDFYMESEDGSDIELSDLREKLEDAFAAVWSGAADDDPLNRLVLVSGLTARETVLLRAYSRFLRQARIPYSVAYMEDALADNPGIARSLVALFHALFDPASDDSDKARASAAEKVSAEIEEALEAVASLDVDRILRRFRNAIQATLRTNYYQPAADGSQKPYVSFKFKCDELDNLPLPRPWREIFVYSTWIEGVHLRGGPVARGGLRWSDRKEDYRTEVLGLVKAQQVKNAVIVPVGSKGGFLPKNLPVGGTREEIQAEGIRAYKTFLSGLLDITDNLDGTKVVPPDAVVRRDPDDPYLVVAADKGTATFSDIANGVAADYGFWLDDAFASGGSNGYDHKGMGITAKGGWEAVKRHFRELGHDTQTQPFTVVGCGDMSGDVFGNGMLLSDQIKLIAAFDHRDIFIDPSPDTKKSFAERKRLFELPRSSWQDYDKKLISKGGGVFPRSAKSVKLTSEIQEMTGIKADQVTPAELIHALLKTISDLLWFGGIGTYIKSSEETHAQADDRANDNIRVDAPQVGARVIGEGANLGVTQFGRIELSARGVKINTDAVDNSAGVDCSDHEVNIKIALGAVVSAGDMTQKQRNNLLAKMTDEVSDLVLKTNYGQTLAISLAEARAPALLEDQARLMRALEAQGRLDRAVEQLPSEEEIAERAGAGRGLTRPEIAVLVAYSKITIFQELAESSVPDDAYMERLLIDYMPTPLREKYKAVLKTHRLRREIIATVAANAFVNEVGPSLYNRLREETGASVAETVRAFMIAREVFGLPGIGAEINALDNKVPAECQIDMHLALSDMASAQSLRLLQGGGELPIGEAINLYGPGVETIAETAGGEITAFSKKRLGQRAQELTKKGAPKELAERVAGLELLGGTFDVIDVASRMDRDVADVAANYFAAGARFGLDWLRSAARQIAPKDNWERIAVGRLMGDIRAQQSGVGAAALSIKDAKPGAKSIEKWCAENAELADRADRLIGELRQGGTLSVSKLAVASSQLRALVGG